MIRDLSRVTPAFRIMKDSKKKDGEGVGREGGKKHIKDELNEKTILRISSNFEIQNLYLKDDSVKVLHSILRYAIRTEN